MNTIEKLDKYKHYCRFTGLCEDSVKSYTSWMNNVAEVVGKDITDKILKNTADVENYKNKLINIGKGKKSVSDHVSAMKKYVEMVNVIKDNS